MRKTYPNTVNSTPNQLYCITIFLLFFLGNWYSYSQSQTRIAGNGFTSGTGTNWNNPGYITLDDTNYATANLGGGGNSRFLRASDFGFSIPNGATITGIEAVIMRRSSSNSGGNSIDDTNVRLLKNAVLTGNDLATTTDWPTSFGIATYGGNANLWGATWTVADINDANFGLGLRVENESGSSRVASVDYIEITVYYTNPTPTITNFSPNNTCANSGISVVISGTNFTGATSVRFNGISASFTINSATQITAILPAGATTGTISVTTPLGTATSSSSFTLNSLPFVNPISGPVDVCQNSSVTLSNSTLGGSWSSSNSGVATINSGGIVTGSSNGTTTITYTFTDSNSCSTSVQAPLTVKAKPIVSSASFVCVGNTFNLSPSSGGSWSSSNPTVASVDSNGLVLGLTNGNSTFTFVDSSTGCAETTSSVEVASSPQITLNPVFSQTVCSGNTVSLSVSATGLGLTYQWYRGTTALINSSTISGTNTPTLQINPISIADAGNDYYCIVSGSCSPNVVSNTAEILVLEEVIITSQPTNSQVVCENTSVSLSVSATGSGLSYQWFKGSLSLSDTGNISGSSTQTLIINSVTPSDAGNDYYCMISGTSPCSGVSSAMATIIINEIPTINTQPLASQTICSGTNTSLQVIASGGDLSYQWYLGTNPVSDGGNISGSSSNVLQFNPISMSNNSSNYYCSISNSCGTINSNYAEVKVNEIPEIIDYNLTICSEEDFNLVPINGFPSATNIVPANTSYSWSLPTVTTGIVGQTAQIGQIQIQIQDTLTNTTSIPQTATYTVTPTSGTTGSCVGNPFSVVVTVNPKPVVNNSVHYVCSGENFSILPVDGSGNIVPAGTLYTWSLPTISSGVLGATPELGASSLNQTLTNTTNSVQTATYNLTATTGSCVGSTFSVTIFINPKPTLSATIVSQTTCSNTPISNISLNNPNGIPGIVTYDWTRDNIIALSGIAPSGTGNIISGTLTNTTNLTQTSNFSIIAVSEYGCQSDIQNVSVVVNPLPTITISPTSQTICSNDSISEISITNPNGVSGTTFNWNRNNNSNLSGIGSSGTGSTINGVLSHGLTSNQTTTFSVVADANGCSTSATTTVTVKPKPTVMASVLSQSLCAGNPITPITISNPNNISGTTYSWVRDNTTNVTGLANNGTGSIISGTPNNFTASNQIVNFTITATANSCSSTPIISEVVVFPRPQLNISNSSQTICDDTAMATVTFSSPNNLTGTTYTWTRTNTTNITGIPSSGTGTSISGTLSNNALSTQTTTFTVTATASNGCSTTSTFTITVYAPFVAPVIGSSQTSCLLSTPGALTMTSLPRGGSGVYTYQWQSSPNNITFTNINGATGASYQPPFLNFGAEDTYYRLIVTNICGVVLSNVVFVEVVSNAGFTFDINNVPTGTVCSGSSFTPQISSLHFSTSAVRFLWSADPTYVTPASGGPVGTTSAAIFFFRTSTGNIGPLTVQNNTNATVTTPIVVTPNVYSFPGPPSGGFICSTSPQTLNITIRPRPVATAIANNSTICSGSGAGIQVNGNITDAPTSFAWVRNNTANVTGTASGNSGNIAPGGTFNLNTLLTNITTSVQNVTFTITPTSNSCVGSQITVTIAVAPTVTGGTIAGNQTLCNGGDPIAFTQTAASNGLNLTYQWQISSDGTNFSDITGANSITYDALGPINQNTWFRRVSISTVNGITCLANSNTLLITVNNVSPGSVTGDQIICSGGDPVVFSGVVATGSGTITYQWQNSTFGCSGPWSNIGGATAASYNVPSGLIITTYYRRIATSTLNSVSCSEISNCLTVTVNSVSPATISGDQTICGNNPDPFVVTNLGLGMGTLSYQWQKSTSGCSGSWSVISGATSSVGYDAPAGLTGNAQYQLVTTSTLNSVQCAVASNCVTVTINSVTSGTISGNRTVCYGGNPSAFTQSMVATGTNLTYQWQMSLSGGAGPWTDITGANLPTYDEPGPVLQTTYYRRMVTSNIPGSSCSAASNFVTVFVNDVSSSVISGNQTVCSASDNPVAFTVSTPANGSGALSYQWFRSTVGCSGPWNSISGATSSTYDPPSISQTTYYQVRVTSTLNSVACIAYSNCLEISFMGKTWNGNSSSSWDNPNNWTPIGVPTSSHCVVIPNVVNDPKIDGSNYNAEAYSIVLLTNSNLDIETTNSLTVQNEINVHSTGVFHVKNGASLVQVSDSAINSGHIKYSRTTRPMTRWAYTYWGSPVAENVMSQIPSQYDLKYRWQSGTQNGTWLPLTTTVPGEGYITRVRNIAPFSTGTGTINATFTGTPNNGLITVNVDSYDSNSLVSGNSALLSNPYPSTIDAIEFLTHPNNSELGGTLSFWTAVTFYSGTGSYNVQDYASWNLTGGTGTAPATDPMNNSLIPNGKISSGQGFFAQIFADGQIQFENSMRETGNNTQFFRTNNDFVDKHRIWLNLYNESKFRQMLVGYVDGATNGSDRLYDGDVFTTNDLNIYSLLEDRKLVIQGRALPFEESDVIPLGYKAPSAGNYTLAIDHVDGLFSGGEQNIYLKDNVLQTVHNLTTTPYVFSSEIGTFDNRFEVVFTANALGIHEKPTQAALAWVTEKTLHVQATQNIREILIFDLSGKELNHYTPEHLANAWEDVFEYPNGMYLLQVKLDDDTVVNLKVAH